MQFRVDEEIFRMFPNFCRAVVVAAGLNNGGRYPELEERLKEQQARAQQDTAINPATHPRLLAWKEAYRQFGCNPNKFTPSIVFLAKQAKAGKPMRSISPAVDAFNLISLKYLVPCGGDDMDSVQDDVTLGRATGEETFAPIFSPESIEHPDAGEVIYVNRRTGRVLCRRWNWRNGDFSKVTPETRNLAINVDGMLPAITRSEIEEAAEELKQLLLQFCGGAVSILYLDSSKREAEVTF